MNRVPFAVSCPRATVVSTRKIFGRRTRPRRGRRHSARNNTFAPLKRSGCFQDGAAVRRHRDGPVLASRMVNPLIAGFVERIEVLDHIAYPLTWVLPCRRTWSEHAFEHIAGLILEGLEFAPPYDAVSLLTVLWSRSIWKTARWLLRWVAPSVPRCRLSRVRFAFQHDAADDRTCGPAGGHRTYPHVDGDTGARTPGCSTKCCAGC